MLTHYGSQHFKTNCIVVLRTLPASMPAGRSPFFGLPLELRQLIYNAVLASPMHGPELLQTCREIHSEAYKVLFSRPLSFRSQVALFNWLDQVPHKYLSQVRELSLNVQDVDLRPLLKTPVLTNHPGDPPRLLTWDLYEAELDRLYNALELLPGIQKLVIRAVPGRQSFLYREFLRIFLSALSSLCPGLSDIQLEGNLHHQSLSFLSGFAKLQGLSFDGFSASSPFEVGNILSGMQNLTSLSLSSQSDLLSPASYAHSNFTTRTQSLTGRALDVVNRLTCFSITEMIPKSAPMLFFTPDILTALHNHRGLKIIKVCLSQAPNDDTMDVLKEFLENSHIKVLELDWPQLDPHVLETFSLIRESLEELCVRASSATAAFEIIWSVAESRDAGNVSALGELILLRSTKTYDEITPITNDRKDSGTGHVESGVDRVSSSALADIDLS